MYGSMMYGGPTRYGVADVVTALRADVAGSTLLSALPYIRTLSRATLSTLTYPSRTGADKPGYALSRSVLPSVLGPITLDLVEDGAVLWRWDVGTDPRDAGVICSGDANRTYFDASGVLHQAAANVPRYASYVRDSQGNWVQVWLLEGAATNLFERAVPTALTDWTTQGDVALDAFPVGGALLASGVHVLDKSVNGWALANASHQANTTYTICIIVVMDDGNAPVVGTGSTTGDFALGLAGVLLNVPATVQRIAQTNAYLVSATASTGATLSTQASGVYFYSTQSSRGFRVTGYQLLAGSLPQSLILTTGAPVTRAAETAYLPWPYAPLLSTFYIKHIELGTAAANTANTAYWHLGNTVFQRAAMYNPSNRPGGLLVNDTTSYVMAQSRGVVLGDQVDQRLTMDATTAVHGLSVNGDPETTVARTHSGLSSVWSGDHLWLNGWSGGGYGFIGLQSFIITQAARDISELRLL